MSQICDTVEANGVAVHYVCISMQPLWPLSCALESRYVADDGSCQMSDVDMMADTARVQNVVRNSCTAWRLACSTW
jgi:hypothetical protein